MLEIVSHIPINAIRERKTVMNTIEHLENISTKTKQQDCMTDIESHIGVVLDALHIQSEACRGYEKKSRQMGLEGTANEWKRKLERYEAASNALLRMWIAKNRGT